MNGDRSATADRVQEKKKKTIINVTDMDSHLFNDVVD